MSDSNRVRLEALRALSNDEVHDLEPMSGNYSPDEKECYAGGFRRCADHLLKDNPPVAAPWRIFKDLAVGAQFRFFYGGSVLTKTGSSDYTADYTASQWGHKHARLPADPEQVVFTDAPSAANAVGALRELVYLKELKEKIDRMKQRRAVKFNRDASLVVEIELMAADYAERKPVAWAAAHEILRPVGGLCKTDNALHTPQQNASTKGDGKPLTKADWEKIESLRPIVDGGPDCQVGMHAALAWKLIEVADASVAPAPSPLAETGEALRKAAKAAVNAYKPKYAGRFGIFDGGPIDDEMEALRSILTAAQPADGKGDL